MRLGFRWFYTRRPRSISTSLFRRVERTLSRFRFRDERGILQISPCLFCTDINSTEIQARLH
ncbi:hypothetical protein BU26DRAFT_55120 [Trematosphaeria pertusa]|uniref:Uncharacterized protein n=1 Tax=Trematosphaeria pertusa TaxID=390896 RepID=A0A6A6I9E9_9PLEO|nr:uncharacterized protein BU26DRAFT_55120 [Trematosphaeria pertusa]KAF2246887.1 hypothetical protein BU26DRAFT_55120 [Trematosphaeria pertusa]